MCGCRGGQRSVGKRPVVTPSQRSVGRGIAQSTPRQLELRAQAASDSTTQNKHMDKQRRELERRRRNLITRRSR